MIKSKTCILLLYCRDSKESGKDIREVSSTAREAVKQIHESGVITELTEAVQEAAVTTKDTAKEIRGTA